MIAHPWTNVKNVIDIILKMRYALLMRYDTVIFDLDGTLLDTLDDLTDGVNHALADFGYPLVSREHMRASLGYGSRYLISHCVPGGYDDPNYQSVFDDYLEYYRAHSSEKTAPYPGIIELLGRLKASGVHCAIVSNKPDSAAQVLGERWFSGLVEAVVGDREGIRRKPAPDSVLEVMRMLGSKHKDTVYIGDSEVDIETAVNAGVDCISVTWGFRTPEQLHESGASVLVSDAKELEQSLN